jgi:AcrR family transcriptional regulator
MRVREADLTAYARIRNAALEGFARDGLEATSMRDVAKAAGVSAGLVQHHFVTKAGLRDAVNEYVIETIADAFSEFVAEDAPEVTFAELGERITATVAENPTALLYVGRALVEGDEAALGLFDALVEIALSQYKRLAERGELRADLDLEWAAMQIVIFNLGTVLLEDAVNRRLPQPFFTPESLERWNRASTALFEHGLAPAPAAKRRR